MTTRVCGNLRSDAAPGEECAIGHPIRKIMTARGYEAMTNWPCAAPKMLARGECPDKTERTPEQRAADREASSKMLDDFTTGLTELGKIKRKMIRHSITHGRATCVWCGKKDALHLTVNIGGNKHMHGSCSECKRSFLE